MVWKRVSIGGAKPSIDSMVSILSSAMQGSVCIYVGVVKRFSGGSEVEKLCFIERVPGEEIARELEKLVDKPLVFWHATGCLKPGDVILVAALAAPSRRECIETLREVIEFVKSVLHVKHMQVVEVRRNGAYLKTPQGWERLNT